MNPGTRINSSSGKFVELKVGELEELTQNRVIDDYRTVALTTSEQKVCVLEGKSYFYVNNRLKDYLPRTNTYRHNKARN